MEEHTTNTVRILVAGDTCPIGVNESRFATGSASEILGDVVDVVGASDLFVLNLECPITDSSKPSPKIGPSLKASLGTAVGFSKIGVDVACIANNHMMDFGTEGLISTTTRLEENGVSVVGGGGNLNDSWRIEARVINGIRIGIVAMAESEFGIAGLNSPGVCPLDHHDFFKLMRDERHRFDHIVVLVHGGNEYYAYPRPGLVKSARFLASMGASAVICQHTHVVGCYEWFGGVPIVYGQGNFIFDYPSKNEAWNEGVLIDLTFSQTACLEIDFIPITQGTSNGAVALLRDEERYRVLNGIKTRSEILSDQEALALKWEQYCKSVERFYLNSLHGRAGIFRRIIGRLGYLRLLESPEKNRKRLNLIRCESHHEVLLSVLSVDRRE